MNFIISPTSSRLTYYGDWIDQGNGAWKFCQDSCALSLSFNGTQISYSGYQEDRAGLMQVVIDNMNPKEFDGSIGANPDGSRVQATLFTQKDLSSTQTHFINVSYAGLGSGGGNYASFFGFNFIQDNTSGNLNVNPNPTPSSSTNSPSTERATNLPSSPLPSSIPSSSQSISSSASISNSSLSSLTSLNGSPSVAVIPSPTGSVVSNPPNASSLPAGAASTTHSNPTAAIVGGVIAGLVLLLALITLLLRSRYKNGRFFGSSASQSASDLSPFNMRDHPSREEQPPSSPKHHLMSETRFTDTGPSTMIHTNRTNRLLNAPGIEDQAESENIMDDDQYTLVDRDRVWEARAHICV